MKYKRNNHEGHEEHEGPRRMRLISPLSDEAESAIRRTIGCAIAVHRTLGPGFLESIYHKAMCVELAKAGLSYECEKAIQVVYHEAQVLSYLKTTGLRAGLLINFHVPVLYRGVKRIVL